MTITVDKNAHYAAPGHGQRYRCIACDAAGASGQGWKPLTYHCHECEGKNTLWPTPQHKLYRELQDENEILRRGMKGDYDLDAWLDWAAHKDKAVILLNLAENMLAEESLVSPGDTSVPNTQEDRDALRKQIVDYLGTLPDGHS